MARLYKDVESNQWLQSAADEKAMEVEWPCRPPRSLTLDARGKAQEGSCKDYTVAYSGEGNEADGKKLEQYSGHGKGSADVEGLRCYATCPPLPPQGNRPRSIYQYSNMAPRLSGQNC